MLIYEVNIRADHAIREAYADLVRDHIQKLLAQKGFQSAEWYERQPQDEGIEGTGFFLWTLHYKVQDRESLDAYFNDLGKTLRNEARERFGTQVQVERRILVRRPTAYHDPRP